jgi:hypothetical protein
MAERSESETRDVNTVDVPFVEMPGKCSSARAVVGIFADPTGAQCFTVTDFEQLSFERVRHGRALREVGVTLPAAENCA